MQAIVMCMHLFPLHHIVCSQADDVSAHVFQLMELSGETQGLLEGRGLRISPQIARTRYLNGQQQQQQQQSRFSDAHHL